MADISTFPFLCSAFSDIFVLCHFLIAFSPDFVFYGAAVASSHMSAFNILNQHVSRLVVPDFAVTLKRLLYLIENYPLGTAERTT